METAGWLPGYWAERAIDTASPRTDACVTEIAAASAADPGAGGMRTGCMRRGWNGTRWHRSGNRDKEPRAAFTCKQLVVVGPSSRFVSSLLHTAVTAMKISILTHEPLFTATINGSR